MALEHIDPFFLPWQQQGVDFLLAEKPVPAAFSLCHAKIAAPKMPPKPSSQAGRSPHPQTNTAFTPAQQSNQRAHATQQGIPRPAQYPSQGATPPSLTQQHPAAHALAQHNTPKPAQQCNQGPAQQLSQGPAQQSMPKPAHPNAYGQMQAPTLASQQPQHIPALLEELPLPWQERLNATNPNAVLWTYWSLGYDLCGYPSDARRNLLKKIIITHLQQSFKEYSLWPAALPTSSPSARDATNGPDTLPELVPHEAAFWTGVERLKARGLVIFGSAAAKAVGLQKEAKPAKIIIHRGCRVLFVNDMDYLVTNTSYQDSMLASLRPFLAPFRHW